MSKTGNVTQLASMLAEKTAQDRQQVEQLMQGELQALAETLKQQSSAALLGTVRDIKNEIEAHFSETRSHFEAQASETVRNLGQIEDRIKAIHDSIAQIETSETSPIKALSSKLEGVSKQITDDLTTPAKGIKLTLTQAQDAIKTQRDGLEAEIKEQTKRLIWLMRWPVLGTLALCLVICLLTWGYWAVASPIETVIAPDGKPWEMVKGGGWQLCQGRPCRRSGTN